MLVKLTKADGRSMYGDVLWEVGKTVSIPEGERGTDLCLPGLLHVYEGNVALAVMLDPIHACVGPNARAFEVRGKLVKRDRQLKAGGHSFKVVRKLAVPRVTLEQRVLFAWMCAFECSAANAANAANAAYAAAAYAAAAAAAYAAAAAARHLPEGALAHFALEAIKEEV